MLLLQISLSVILGASLVPLPPAFTDQVVMSGNKMEKLIETLKRHEGVKARLTKIRLVHGTLVLGAIFIRKGQTRV